MPYAGNVSEGAKAGFCITAADAAQIEKNFHALVIGDLFLERREGLYAMSIASLSIFE